MVAVRGGHEPADCLFFPVNLRSDGQEVASVPVRVTSQTLTSDGGLDQETTVVLSPEPQITHVKVLLREADFGRNHELTITADPHDSFEETDNENNSITVTLSLPHRDTIDPALACPPDPTEISVPEGGPDGATPPAPQSDPAALG